MALESLGAEFQRFHVQLEQPGLAVDAVAGGAETGELTIDDALDVAVARVVGDDGGKGDFRLVGNLRLQPRDVRLEPGLAQEQLPLLHLCGDAVEPDQWLAGSDVVALADQDLLDDAAFQMLDDLVLPGRHEAAGGDHGRGQRRGRRPCAEAAKGDHHKDQPDDAVLVDRARNLAVPFDVVDVGDACVHDGACTG